MLAPKQVNSASRSVVEPGTSPAEDEPDDSSERLESRSPVKSDSPALSAGGTNNSISQKRRRVTRACDECRRKKIKCDGKNPCAHCSIYGYDCTYDQPSNRRRNPTPQYIEALELKLARAEAVIRTYLPNVDLDDPNIDSLVENLGAGGDSRFLVNVEKARVATSSSTEQSLESMVRATGQLDLDEKGNWDYHGHSSGLSFIRQVRNQLGDLDGPEQAIDDLKQRQVHPVAIPSPNSPRQMLGSSASIRTSYFHNDDPGTDDLPSKELALSLCSAALDDATGIINIVHHPSFYHRVDRIYSLSQDQYDNEDQRFLPLLYTVLGLGCLYAKDEHSELETKGYRGATGIGDLTTLQAIVFMILFLQSSAKLATCYAYIGVALRSAIRMGLHRSFRDSFDPIESEIRKRLFWTIRKMDIYVGAMLGLPLTLIDADIDQELPMELSDECLLVDRIDPTLQRGMAPMVCANAEFRLLNVYTKIVKTIYPIKGFQRTLNGSPNSYSVSYTAIREIEADMQKWQVELPEHLQPNSSAPVAIQRMQQLLRMFFAYAQLILYRPFLHYVSAKHKMKNVNQRSYACATACISVSRNIIQITSQMNKGGLLQGSYWFSMYSTFFGILSLVFFALENPEGAESQDVLKVAKEGKDSLAALAKRSMAADRCTSSLTTLFDHLGPNLEYARKEVYRIPSRKREAAAPASDTRSAPPTASSSSEPSKAKEIAGRGKTSKTKRSSTMPHPSGSSSGLPQPQQPLAQAQRRPTLPSTAYISQTLGGDSPITPSSSSAFGTPISQATPQHFQQPRSLTQASNQAQQIPFLPTQFHDPQYATTVKDMSAVMFPSDDPFAYPNPPMTTLEPNYAFGSNPSTAYNQAGQVHGGQDIYLPTSTEQSTTVSADEGVDQNLLASQPAYVQYSQAPGGDYQDLNSWHPRGLAQVGQSPNRMASHGVEMYNIQARSHGLPELNLGDIFGGEEWRMEE